jgi:hypothetical protein
MKKILFNLFVIVSIFSTLFFVSCQKDESTEHKYTPEELAEIARQDSLKKIIPADYVFTQDVTLPWADNYDGITIKLCTDTAKLLELFDYKTVSELVAGLGTLVDGAQTGNDITFYAYNHSTKYEFAEPSTTNYFGHWFDANGDVCTWGDQALLYCEKTDTFSLNFTLGQYPSRPEIGSVYHIVEAMKYDTTSVAFLFNITIGPEKEIEVPVTTIVGTETVSFDAQQNNDYASVAAEFNVDAITAAIGINPAEAKLYGVNADGSLFVKPFTANNGYWYTRTGNICSWGDPGCAFFAEYDAENQKVNVGQFPDSCVAGQTYTARLAFVNMDNLKQYTLSLAMTVTPAEQTGYPVTTLVTTLNLALSVAAQPTDYVDNVLSLDTVAIQTAIGVLPQNATLYGVNAATDSLVITGFTGNNGYWYTAAGNVCAWGAEGVAMYVEYRPDTREIGFGQFPGGCTSGTTYYGRLAFVNGDKRAEVKVAMTIQ